MKQSTEGGKLLFKFNYPFDFLNKLSACARCKWIGSEDDMGYLFLEQRNYLNEKKTVKCSCCPKCGNYVGTLTIKFLGVLGFIESYIKKDVLEEIEIKHEWFLR